MANSGSTLQDRDKDAFDLENGRYHRRVKDVSTDAKTIIISQSDMIKILNKFDQVLCELEAIKLHMQIITDEEI